MYSKKKITLSDVPENRFFLYAIAINPGTRNYTLSFSYRVHTHTIVNILLYFWFMCVCFFFMLILDNTICGRKITRFLLPLTCLCNMELDGIPLEKYLIHQLISKSQTFVYRLHVFIVEYLIYTYFLVYLFSIHLPSFFTPWYFQIQRSIEKKKANRIEKSTFEHNNELFSNS